MAVVRLSGRDLGGVLAGLLGRVPEPRQAIYTSFLSADGDAIDQGIALYFPAPRSYTGQDTLELQCHGNPLIADHLLRRAMELGARLANPGEFTQRAFLNGKLDLAQAEAVADLINATTDLALRSARHSLEGVFSQQVDGLARALIQLRVQIEAALDFSDEDIDYLEAAALARHIEANLHALDTLLAQTRQGVILREGYTVVLAGRPNSGKSSLLNALSGRDSAIVTDVPGTTRDVLREPIQIDGMPLHIIDTAGLRRTDDPVEQEGVRRARSHMAKANRILHIVDASHETAADASALDLPPDIPITRIHNKVDLTRSPPGIRSEGDVVHIHLSAKTGAGIDALKQHLKQAASFQAEGEGLFIARRRHLDALTRCRDHLADAVALTAADGPELIAEQLRLAHDALGEITGTVSADDLLGHIFSTFCVGK
ncbi:tRNA modification GTPase MnmE [Methylogaea oryzae]|uniref:tRNA modification GTPase MnmE n=1 Tax=Methylogaea oryzae TaxID=1295382 RepID=A0A8D5APC1_9GAMM|nr:tRNA modification GTPase MnmE [Methylogaea oryzae]